MLSATRSRTDVPKRQARRRRLRPCLISTTCAALSRFSAIKAARLSCSQTNAVSSARARICSTNYATAATHPGMQLLPVLCCRYLLGETFWVCAMCSDGSNRNSCAGGELAAWRSSTREQALRIAGSE